MVTLRIKFGSNVHIDFYRGSKIQILFHSHFLPGLLIVFPFSYLTDIAEVNSPIILSPIFN